MDRFDDIRARQREQVVVALELAGPVGKALATEVRFLEAIILQHRAHAAIEDHDALA